MPWYGILRRDKRTFPHGFLARVKELGIPLTPGVRSFTDKDELIAHCNAIVENLHSLDFEVDGLSSGEFV